MASTAGLPSVAVIGLGPQGRGLLGQFLGSRAVVRAVCDCDRVRCEDGARRVNEFYRARPELGVAGDACRAEADFRKVLDDPSIDAVCVATPDHWHAYMTVEAMKRGKDVYCEKPLTYSVDEARVIVEVAKRTGRILQTGAMQRSGYVFRTACELVRNGVVGRVKYVENQFGGPSCPHRPYKDLRNWEREGAPNPDVDFDMWLGPAPRTPYSEEISPRGVHNFCPQFWRNDDYFGSGQSGNWGAHHLDVTQWGMGRDGTGPVKVLASEEPRPREWETGFRRQSGARLVYADGLTVRHVAVSRWGTAFFGDRGIVCVDRGRFAMWEGDASGLEVTPAVRKALSDGVFDGGGLRKVAFYAGRFRLNGGEFDSASEEFGRSAEHAIKVAGEKLGLKRCADRRQGFDFAEKLYRSDNHVKNFVECCVSRSPAISNHDVGPWSSVLCQLVNLCYTHDAGFAWDPGKMAFANGDGRAEWLSREDVRPGANHDFDVKA